MQTPQLLRRKRLALSVAGISTVFALVCALLSVNTLSLFPPDLKPRQIQVAAADTEILVDSPSPKVLDRNALPEAVDALAKHAELLGRVMASRTGVERIARRAGIPPELIGVVARTTANVPLALTEPGSEQRASEIPRVDRPYRLEIQGGRTRPTLSVYAQAPSTGEAKRLANASLAGLRDYVRSEARRQGLPPDQTVTLRQLGPPRGGVVNSHAAVKIAVLTFVVAFALACCALLLVARARSRRVGAPAGGGGPRLVSWMRGPPPRQPAPHDPPAQSDDWPHTTRVLPWMLAGFMGVLWLVPFNEIELKASLPIDLKFDRLLLPIIAATWALSLTAGGRLGRRPRLTWIHIAVGAFVACAFLSVVLQARYLNQTLELDESLKRLPLLVSYVMLFAIAASVVRRTEVKAFLNYALGLAVLCAAGVIWEYRFKYNVFFGLSDTLLPGIFTISSVDPSAIDGIGRPVVHGPGAVPLEAVAMLSMSLPISLVGVIQAKQWRGRIAYAMAACLLMAATVATFRKSGLLAPLSILLTLAYFRRRELLRLAPLGLVLLLAVHILSPGALGSTASQLSPDRLGVATVSDRAVDYDAIRPDLWTHLAFGRGWGSYDHTIYRILDNEILQRLIEMGLVGLLAYVLMAVAVVAAARRTIGSRDPTRSPPALIGASAAVSFLVVSMLFDVLSFPHVTYIFLLLAGLVAVVVEPLGQQDGQRAPERTPHSRRLRPRAREIELLGSLGGQHHWLTPSSPSRDLPPA